jgi:hypothetical protein
VADEPQDDELPTPRDERLELIFQRTPDTEREAAMRPSESGGDDDFWGFADTLKRVRRLDLKPVPRKLTRPPSIHAPTPPRLSIPPASSALTPLPRVWTQGDLMLAFSVAAAAIVLLVLLILKA